MISFITVVLFLVGLMAIWMVGALFWQLITYLHRPERTVVGEFLDSGKPKEEHATKFFDRWLNLRSAGGELEKAGADLPFAVGGDFLLAEIDRRTGNELEKAFSEWGRDVDIKVAGVSILGFAKFLDSIAHGPQRTIEGRVSRYGNEITLTVTLRDRGGGKTVWIFTRTTPSNAESAALEDLMDEAICQVAVHLRTTDPNQPNQGASSMEDTAQLSPKALASLTKGRRSLNRYVRDSAQADLEAAQRHFRSLVESSPDYPNGCMMLAYTLAENREEDEAIEMYNRVITLLNKAEVKDERRIHEARFLRACSLLRRYRWKHAVEAIKGFRELAGELDPETGGNRPSERDKKNPEARRRNRYLLARCHAEIAHCFGHLIVFLPKDRPLDDDERSQLGELVGNEDLDKLDLPDKDKDRFADRARIADCFHRQSESCRKTSESVDLSDNDKWQAERRLRLNEVVGYARYRSAEWLDASQGPLFHKECTEAIRSLKEAELRKPRQYALLQNIGMILLNRRYDPAGENLAQAETYYQRSVDLKPGDYFGYEQLARVRLRRMLAATDQADRDAAATAGGESLAKALKLRFDSPGATLLRLYFRLAKLALQPASKASDVEALRADVDRYEPDGKHATYRWMRLCCDWLLLLTGSDAGTFNAKKAALASELKTYQDGLEGSADRSWRTSQMLGSVQKLRAELAAATFETRASLKLQLEAALD